MKQVQLTVEDIRSRFQMKFKGAVGNVYAAPGRINLIGEHTDYNGGYVFPGAVDKGMVAEVRPNGTDLVRAFAIDLYETVEFDINDKEGPKESWARYIYGICQEMKARGVDVKGFDTALGVCDSPCFSRRCGRSHNCHSFISLKRRVRTSL